VPCGGASVTYNFLDHVHDLLLHQVQVLGIPSWGSADHIIHLDIFVLFTQATAIHGIGEFDKNRVFFHDALNVLTTNANDTFVILVGNVERDGRWHLLLDKIKSVFGGFVLTANHVNVEIVFIESIEDDLYVACTNVSMDLSFLESLMYFDP
jgi:hypothetical protein